MRVSTRALSMMLALPLALGLGLTACGDDDDDNGNGTPDAGQTDDGGTDDGGSDDDGGNGVEGIQVDGLAQIHPLTQNVSADLSIDGAEIRLERASAKLTGADGTLPAGDGDAVATLTAGEDPQAAEFLFEDVDTSQIVVALVATIDDAEGATEDVFVPTVTGLATAADVGEDVSGANAFVTDAASITALETISGQTDMLSQGIILGTVLDGTTGAPLDGAAITSGGTAVEGAIYPTAMFDGVEDDGNTSANGTFVIVGGSLATYAVDAAGRTCSSQQAATLPGHVFVMFLSCE